MRAGDRGDVPLFRAITPGPHRVGLLYRVGAVDEGLPRRGLTHFVEHLALSTIGPRDHPYNGFVSSNLTAFIAEGTPAEVTRFLADVVTALTNLPTDRLDVERRVLMTEAGGRRPSAAGELLFWRYGAVGFGVAGMEELAIQTADEQVLRRWASDHFRAGNSAVWIAGPDPELVSLPPLPSEPGRASAPPSPTPAVEEIPGWGVSPLGGPYVGLESERSPAFTAALEILTDRAQERLRTDEGVVYGIETDYEALTATIAHVAIAADCLPEHGQAATDGLLDTLEALQADGPTPAELARLVRRRERGLDDPFALLGEAAAMARDALLGGTPTSVADQIEASRQLEPSDVAAALQSARTHPFLLVPPGASSRHRGFTSSSERTPDPLEGREHQPARTAPPDLARQRIVLGPDGIGLHDDAHRISMRFDECAAICAWDNGVRTIYAHDGAVLHFAPKDWTASEEIELALRAATPADIWVQLAGEPAYSGHDAREGRRLRWRQRMGRVPDVTILVLFYIGIPVLGIVAAVLTRSLTPFLGAVVVLLWQHFSWRRR